MCDRLDSEPFLAFYQRPRGEKRSTWAEISDPFHQEDVRLFLHDGDRNMSGIGFSRCSFAPS